MDAKKNGLVKISDTDCRMFMLLLQQKCLTVELLLKWLAPEDLLLPKGRRSKLYFRLVRLVKTGFLQRHRADGEYIYVLGQKGLEVVQSLNSNKLGAVSLADLETVSHDLVTASTRHYLESQGAVDWISEREPRLHVDKIPYLPDGACTVAKKPVFVEVELTKKSKDRYDKIAEIYTAERGPARVVYFYQDEGVVNYLMEKVSHHERLGFFPFDEPMKPMREAIGRSRNQEVSLGEFLGL